MDNPKYLWAGILVAVVIALVSYFHTPVVQQAQQTLGAISDYFSGDYFVASTGYWTGTPQGKTPSDSNGLLTQVSIGSCITNSNTGTSTLLSVANPFASVGTSTAFIQLYGTQGATTTDILVATSTTAAPTGIAVATSSLGTDTLIGAFKVATGTGFYFSSGNQKSWSVGTYTNNSEIQVGPNELLVGFSTSTYAASGGVNGGIAAGTLGIPSSCTYKITWYR